MGMGNKGVPSALFPFGGSIDVPRPAAQASVVFAPPKKEKVDLTEFDMTLLSKLARVKGEDHEISVRHIRLERNGIPLPVDLVMESVGRLEPHGFVSLRTKTSSGTELSPPKVRIEELGRREVNGRVTTTL